MIVILRKVSCIALASGLQSSNSHLNLISEQRREPKGSIPQLAKRKREEEGDGEDKPAVSKRAKTSLSDEEAVNQMCKKITAGTLALELQIKLIDALKQR